MNEEEIYLIEKREKQQKIINSIHAIYVLYPEIEKINYKKNALKEEKKVINVKKGKNNLIAITSSASGVAIASLMDMQLNMVSFTTTLAVTALGGLTLFRINYEGINEIKESKKEYKEINRIDKQEKRIYQEAMYDYLYNILDYLEYYDNNTEFTDEIYTIFNENEDYIKQKTNSKDFEKDFNLKKVIELHYNVFGDIRIFNQEIKEAKDAYEEETNQNNKKILKKKNNQQK